MKRISSLLLAVVFIFALFTLTACSAKEPSGTYIGYFVEDNFPLFEATFENGYITYTSFLTGEQNIGTYTFTDNKVYDNYSNDYLTYDPETDTLSGWDGEVIFKKEK